MKGQDYCSCGDCRLCWPRISKSRVAIGLFLWVATVFLFITHLNQWYPGIWWVLGFVVPIGCLIVRAYLLTARLTTYFYPKYAVQWTRLVLCVFFTCVPILDFLYISQGMPKVVVRHFFANEWPNLMEDLAEELQFRGYDVTVTTGKECLIYAMNEQYDVKIDANNICMTHNGSTKKFQFCVLDGALELAERIAVEIEKSKGEI